MLIFLGVMTALGGLFLFLWYRTIVSLPAGRQPQFIHPAAFKWGIPAVSLVVFASGLYMLSEVGPLLPVATLLVAVVVTWLILKFDRYSAEMRVIHSYYRKVHRAGHGMDETEALFLTARWRYPEWTDDRILELVAGKDIENLMLLMLIQENRINPISDWELYRSLKVAAARIARTAN